MTSWWIIVVYLGILAMIPISIIVFSTGITKINNRVRILKSMGIDVSCIISAKEKMKYFFIGYWVIPVLFMLVAGLTGYYLLALIGLILWIVLFVLIIVFRAKALKLSWLPEPTKEEAAEMPSNNAGDIAVFSKIKTEPYTQTVNDSSYIAEEDKVLSENIEIQQENKSHEIIDGAFEVSNSSNDYQFCRKCGKIIPADSVFCNYCGTEVVKYEVPKM